MDVPANSPNRMTHLPNAPPKHQIYVASIDTARCAARGVWNEVQIKHMLRYLPDVARSQLHGLTSCCESMRPIAQQGHDAVCLMTKATHHNPLHTTAAPSQLLTHANSESILAILQMLSCAHTSVDVWKVSDNVGRRVVCGRQWGTGRLAPLVCAVKPVIERQPQRRTPLHHVL
jgi:hypothetical protein